MSAILIHMGDDKRRWRALDSLRGLAVFLMLPVNAAMDFTNIPPWFKHAPGSGVTMVDFIMPAFLFALGLSSSFSLGRRLKEKGPGRALLHGLLRYAILFACGTLGFLFVWHERNWEILQMLGLTGALALPFLFLAPRWRFPAAAVLLVLVELLRPVLFGPAFQAWYVSGIGGPWGTIPLAAIPIAASGLGEILRNRPRRARGLIAAGSGIALLALAALAWALLSVPNKHLLTPAYVLLTTGTACLALAFLELIDALLRDRDIPLLGPLGRNPLLAYIAGGILTLLVQALLPADTPSASAWLASLGVLLVMTTVALILDWKRLYLRL